METGNFLMPPLGFSDFERQSHHRDRKTVRRVSAAESAGVGGDSFQPRLKEGFRLGSNRVRRLDKPSSDR